jgi:amino acid adenylation domain-containing protein
VTAFLLDQLLRTSAERDADAAAVRHGDMQRTYGELASGAARVASLLSAHGVRRGDRVLLHAPKSVHVVEALYGILGVGAAYVPVEPGSPAPRLAAIAEQCKPRAVVTWKGAAEKLTDELCRSAGIEVVLALDAAGPFRSLSARVLGPEDAQRADASWPAVGTVDQDLAYVLFTSGSTGTPKGVMLSHRNALTFVEWVNETFGLRPDDRLSNHAPLNFDLSILDLFGAARAGASVTLVPEGLGMFPTRLAQLIERERLTVWYSVPSILTLLLTRGSLAERDLSALRWILFAGEVFPVKHLRNLMRLLPTPRYANLYGPTETNVVTWYEVSDLDDDRVEPIPIGKACANTDCIVLDEHGQVVTERGREGVLHVRGSTVMRGYYGRPAETEASFLPSPAAEGRDELLYCTGDWVVLDENDDFAYLGRRDHMVKSGGYRIELGEIETALHAHAAVHEAVAVPVPDDDLGNRIVAVVVAEDVSAQELRAHCAALVPRYMVPGEIIFRAELPRTPNDKVDRRLLASEHLDTVPTTKGVA